MLSWGLVVGVIVSFLTSLGCGVGAFCLADPPRGVPLGSGFATCSLVPLDRALGDGK